MNYACPMQADPAGARMILAALPLFIFPSFTSPMALRIDVDPRHIDLERELDEQLRRLQERAGASRWIDTLERQWPGLRFHYREADGEQYVYVEDLATRQLAGYTVFNRLVERDRCADRHLRAPHSKYREQYQRKGIATAVYRWWLDAGRCLITGARQSVGAHALWQRLAGNYCRLYVELYARVLRQLCTAPDDATREALSTRMILLGAGWTPELLVVRAGMRAP